MRREGGMVEERGARTLVGISAASFCDAKEGRAVLLKKMPSKHKISQEDIIIFHL